MDIKSYIKKIALNTCVIFTAITVAYGILVSLMNPDAEQILIDGTRIVLFFFFALLVSLANALLSIKKMPSAIRVILHYLLSTFAFYLCVLFPVADTKVGAGFTVVGLSLFTVAYALGAATVCITRTSHKRNKEKKETYENRFSK